MDEKLEALRRGRTKKQARIQLAIVCSVLALILWGMVWPAIKKTPAPAKIARDRGRIKTVSSAIEQYINHYQRFPLSSNAISSGSSDFTLGTADTGTEAQILRGQAYLANNSESIGILMALTSFWNGSPTVNVDHSLNPKRMVYLSERNPTEPKERNGVGMDGVLRDSWRNPYIITFDLNGDGRCEDPSTPSPTPLSSSGLSAPMEKPMPHKSPTKVTTGTIS